MICLMPNCAYLSETSRMLAIYKALVARGAPVCVATHGGTWEHLLRDHGAAYEIIGPRMDDARSRRFVRDGIGIGNPAQSMYSDAELRAYVEAEAALFRAKGVKVAVTGFTLTALLSTRVAGIPLATEHAGSWVPPLWERGLLPVPSKLPRPWMRYVPSPMLRVMLNARVPSLDLYTSGFNRVAAELGIEGVPSMPALLLGDLTLVTDVPEVVGIPEAELDAWTPKHPGAYRSGTTLRYVGPLYAELDVPVPPRVDDFLARPGPIVYVAITSSTEALVRAAIEGVRATGARVLAVSTVHELADLDGDSVMIERVLPSHLVMPRVAVAVTAGGQGSVQTAMASGTPVVGIPLQPEQDLNVVLLERRGAARRVKPSEAATPRLSGAIRALLDDARAIDAAIAIQNAYRRWDAAARSAELIVGCAARDRAAA